MAPKDRAETAAFSPYTTRTFCPKPDVMTAIALFEDKASAGSFCSHITRVYGTRWQGSLGEMQGCMAVWVRWRFDSKMRDSQVVAEAEMQALLEEVYRRGGCAALLRWQAHLGAPLRAFVDAMEKTKPEMSTQNDVMRRIFAAEAKL